MAAKPSHNAQAESLPEPGHGQGFFKTLKHEEVNLSQYRKLEEQPHPPVAGQKTAHQGALILCP